MESIGPLRRLERVLDVDRVERAIATAEGTTSAEIRVSVCPFFWGSIHRAARRAFIRLGMDRTKQRNGVLIFVVPSRRSVVVLGDEGIHRRTGDALWNRAVDEMLPLFRRGELTEGVIRGIEVVASSLSEYFPRGGDDTDELPNAVDVGHRSALRDGT
ncbi:MAG TPA: TPM domain-containing protein [Polyangiaceae bacterium]|nr:TPM domain-containing protein [Polyangiaceae bacterium]